MSCEDKNANIDDVVSEINKDLKLNELSEQALQSLLDLNPNLADIIEQEMLCDLPSDVIFTDSQLKELGCDVDGLKPLPEIPNNLDIDTGVSESNSDQKCQEAVDKANVILKREQKEYNELSILLEKLIEYRYNYKAFAVYYTERLNEMNRLINLFQPILEIIKGYEAEVDELQEEVNDLINSQGSEALIQSKQSDISDLNEKISEQQQTIDSLTTEDDVLSDLGIQNSASSIRNADGEINSSTILSNINYILESEGGAATVKAVLQSYSSAIDIDSNLSVSSNLISNATFTFKFDFVGLNFIQSQEDVYNEQNGKRNTRDINFPIKNNSRLEKNDFFEDTTGLDIRNETIGTIFTGKLYTEYYNKLDDPIGKLFNLNERGLTDQESLADASLVSAGLSKKRENAGEFFIQDFKKMESFYQDLEQKIEVKKQAILKNQVDPSFQLVETNLKRLANAEVRMLLAIGGINQSLIEEDSNLSSIIETIQQSQQDFVTKNANLNSEIKRIKTRLKEIKPTPDRVKDLLASIDSKCFSDQQPKASPADLESKVDKAKGDDPFGVKSLEETDPTLPTILDFKYWLEFSKTLNKVALLPLPKTPNSLRYWPVGLFFPTPAGKLIKIPLPIIWIPLVVIPSPTGVLVVFLTINGAFISPIVFKINSNGTKQHLFTARGPSGQFGYTGEAIKSTIRVPLNILAAKDAALNSNQNPLDKLPDSEKEKFEIRKQSLEEKLDRLKPGSLRYKKIKKRLDNLEDSVSGKSENEKLQENVDKEESPLDAIDKAKQAVIDRMNQLGEPEFANSSAIQQEIESSREETKKQIDEVYKSKLSYKEKRKKLKQLRKEMKQEKVSMSRKKDALQKDILDFFDNIKLPTIKIPKDSTKLNPPPSPLAQLKEDSEEQLSNFKNDPTAEGNKKVKNSMKRELSSILDIISVEDIAVNDEGKVDISKNSKQIKDKLNEITLSLTNKLKGETTENPDQLESQIEELEKRIDNESDRKEKRKLKKELSTLNSRLSNYNQTQQLKTDNAMTPEKLKEVSDVKFSFNPFKSLTELLPVQIGFDPSSATLQPIDTAKVSIDNYVNSLDSSGLQKLFGGQDQISPNSIKDLYFNIINEQVPNDLKIENSLQQKDILASSSGLLSSLALPTNPVGLLSALTLPAKIPIDLNILISPLRNLILKDMDDLFMCMPVNINTDFNSLNPTDMKVELQNKILNKLDDLTDIIAPLYAIISFAKAAKGISLTKSEINSFVKLPFGPLDFARFSAETLLKVNSPNSFDLATFNLPALDNAKKSIEPIVAPIMDNPTSYIIPAAAASIGLSEIQRQLHPVIDADDLPPWERLSSRNFLFILFLDEFISEAAEKVGFFRTFI